MNCLLSNWKTPTEFRSTHLDRQINKRNGERMAMEILCSRADPLYICLIKINSSWWRHKPGTPCSLQTAPNSTGFQRADVSREPQARDPCSVFSLSGLKSSGGREGRGRVQSLGNLPRIFLASSQNGTPMIQIKMP